MPLNIKHPEADRLARELAKRTGESITDAVINALRERLAREEGRTSIPELKDEILAISKRCAALPDLDRRSADEIIGYDRHGLPR
ncbi:MAG: type II toxin-antitoxin system VapB family antitoxin [Candidatus Binataceae bacterium]